MNNIKQPHQPAERVIREAECRQLTGICRTTRYMMEKEGAFQPAASWEVAPLVGFCLRSQHGSRAVAKQRKGWGMSDKTKAALQSCQCHYQMFKQKQNTGLHAGGQSLSELQNSNSVLVGFSSNRGEVSKTYIRQWRTLDHTAKTTQILGGITLCLLLWLACAGGV